MAKQEHLTLLKRGVQVWNQWRREHPEVRPDLREANLQDADFHAVNLHRANLYGANLHRSCLNGACLSEANLSFANLDESRLIEAYLTRTELTSTRLAESNLCGANLRRANITGAGLQQALLSDTDCSEANFGGANMSGVNLSRANLRRCTFSSTLLNNSNLSYADLGGASLYQVNLNHAILNDALVGWTRFDSVDLRDVSGLATLHHLAPSTVGIDTLYLSQGLLPEIFLRGCGVPDSMITYAHSLVTARRPIDYYSCFISYSSQDEDLARRLYADLQAAGVRCWYAPEDLKIGESILRGIDEGIRLYDKLLLILSEASMGSPWVEHEVQTALARGLRERRAVLFPIHIDDAALHNPSSWAGSIRDICYIGDFRQWKDHDAYQVALTRLLRDLQTA